MDQLSVSLVAIFTASLFHTLIPSHWLCFVVVGRAQGWRTRRTLAMAAAAGTLHVVATMGLGVAAVAFGEAFLREQGGLLERLSALLLIGLGALYLLSHLLQAGHRHAHDQEIPEKAAFGALVASLVLSPCSVSIPILVVAFHGLGWGALLLMGAVLLVTTVGVMMVLVGLTALGIERLQFAFFDRYEKLIVGLVLVSLGALVLVAHP